jgi:hypothetical protein
MKKNRRNGEPEKRGIGESTRQEVEKRRGKNMSPILPVSVSPIHSSIDSPILRFSDSASFAPRTGG